MANRKNLKRSLTLLVFLVVLGTAATAAARTIYVDDDGPAEYDNIQEAIDDSNDGDTVIVAEGTYYENINFGGKNIILRSIDPNNLDIVANTIIDGGQNGSVVTFNSGEDANCVLSGFTITNGYADINGGGIYCYNSEPTITNCIISNNSAEYPGGGMQNYGGSPVLTNCTFTGNFSKYDHGGGMYNQASNPTLTNCTFSGNSSEGMGGGGMCNAGNGDPTLTNCTFSGNWANWGGGGIINFDSNPTLTNCTFSGNWVDHNGGGMYNIRSSPILTNCTFSGNWASGDGGGIYNSRSSSVLTNCIFWGNTAPDGKEIALGLGWGAHPSTLTVNYSNVAGGLAEAYVEEGCTLNWGEGNIDVDPCFVNQVYWNDNGTPDIFDDVWFHGDYHLLPGSPCIDAGDPNYPYDPNETDLDGRPRVIDGRIDMGAYEYGLLVSAEVRIVPRTINLASRGKWITCYIRLPEEYSVADIDTNSILLEGEIGVESFLVVQQEQVALAKFRRCEVQDILNPPMADQVELTITGQLTDGTVFEGTDVIRVLNKGGGKSPK